MIFKKKISSHVQEKWFNSWYAAHMNHYLYYSYNIWESWNTMILFPNRSGVGGVRFLANSISQDQPTMKAWEYEIVA